MHPHARHARAATVLLLLAVAGACSAPGGSATPTPTEAAPSPSVAPSVAPSAAPSDGGGEGVIVTFRVADTEEYRVLLTDAEDIAVAERLLAGEEAPSIPNGVIVRGGDGGVNTGYSWHIDPDSVEFAEMTIEVCDGLPSYVEDGSLTGDRFCPWSAEVIEIEPAG
jgi:hypothetical protein